MTPMRLLPNDKDIGWVPYVWLVYLLAIPLNAWFLESTPLLWLTSSAGILCFLFLYFRSYWVEGRELLWMIGLITALGIATTPINPSCAVYFVYAAAFAGKLEKRSIAASVIGGVLAVIAIETWIVPLPVYFGLYCVVLTAAISIANLYYGEQHRARKKLQHAEAEIQHLAQVAERERIARDLHDVLGHTLSLIVLKSELASKLTESNPARAVEEIRDVERISRDALAQIRATIQGYHAASLQAEAQQAAQALEAAGVKAEWDIAPAGLPSVLESVLALALREGVTNVIRHAKATSCSLRLEVEPGGCQLEIRDNGCGQSTPEGVGLSGMRRRVEGLGGKLRRETSSGTRLIITLPSVLK
jgi:two-component system sensor histidine kinase DesK